MSNIAAKTQTEMLTLIKSALPQRVMKLLQGQKGEGILAAIAKLGEALSGRFQRLYDDLYYLQASRGAYATSEVEITWTSGTFAAVTILKGQPILQTRWGQVYVLDADVVAGPGEAPGYTVTVPVRSMWRTHEADVDRIHLTEWYDELTEGANPEALVLFDSGTSDAGKQEFLNGVLTGDITIAPTTDATGGRLPLLDLMAQAHGIVPGEDETALQLANRMRKPPEVHSPDAILNAVNAILKPLGVTATLLEPWEFAMTWGDTTNFADGNGAWGVSPWGRLGYFVVSVPDFGYEADGLAWEVGAWGVHPWGTGDVSHIAVLQGLQDLVDSLTLAGVKGFVVGDGLAA